ncbi:MAG: hypothetical protein K0Q59_979 [Paenibacillus sp.]|jgi:hypothetical protein|nr:hypothetical protein [Paenibacillus sp.]
MNHLQATPSATPIRLPSGVPQYLWNDDWIAEHRKITRTWLEAELFPQPVLVPEHPWEGRLLHLFGTVFPHPVDGLRMYYSNLIEASQDVLLATSKDGVVWEKPNLGLVDWNGSKNNNIVLAAQLKRDSPSLAHDADDPDFPFKMMTFEQERSGLGWGMNKQFGLHTYRSRDGLSWEKFPEGSRLRAGDRTNLKSTKHAGVYVAYTRHLDMMKNYGQRCIFRTESADFVHWSEPQLVLKPDLLDAPDAEFYGLTVFERHGWQIGLLEVWHSDRDLLQIHLIYSRDGITWSRANPRKPFIAAKYDWNRKWTTCASNGPVIIGPRMVFYVGGRYNGHNRALLDTYGQIGYATLPIDQFCALEAFSPGQWTTVLMEWPGGELILNADTRISYDSHPGKADGMIEVDVLTADGTPVEGWSGTECGLFCGNTYGPARGYDPSSPTLGRVNWRDGKSFQHWQGQTLRLRFRMRHARLFTFAAGNKEGN